MFVRPILDFNIKLWWILVGIILCIGIIYLFRKFSTGKEIIVLHAPPELPSEFKNYREGKPKKWKWTWDYKWNSKEEVWNVTELIAYCPNCNTPLMLRIDAFHDQVADCPRCDFYEDENAENSKKIERIIIDDIERRKK